MSRRFNKQNEEETFVDTESNSDFGNEGADEDVTAWSDDDDCDAASIYNESDDQYETDEDEDEDEEPQVLKSKHKQERNIIQNLESRQQTEREMMQNAVQQAKKQLKDFPLGACKWIEAQANTAPVVMQIGDPQDWSALDLTKSPASYLRRVKPKNGTVYQPDPIIVTYGPTNSITVIDVKCEAYQTGSCALGEACTRLHEKAAAPKKALCRNYPNCSYGDSCKYLHTSQPKLLVREHMQTACNFYPNCKKGDACTFLHLDRPTLPASAVYIDPTGSQNNKMLPGMINNKKKHLLCNNMFTITKTKIQPSAPGFCKHGDNCYYAHSLQEVKDEIVKDSFKCLHKECRGVELVTKIVEKNNKQLKKIKYINASTSQFICLKSHNKENPSNFILRTAEAREKFKARKQAQNGTVLSAPLPGQQRPPKHVQKRQTPSPLVK